MESTPLKLPKWLDVCFWGNTTALSWMWGLGLFFSVQFTTQFGLYGLLSFIIPNFIGLLGFGLVVHCIARRQPGSESLANFFSSWSRPFRLVFFLYQILAITLTIFALLQYLWRPLDLQPQALYLPLTVLIILAAAILFGEEFNIRKIKFSHAGMTVILLVAIAWILRTQSDSVIATPTRYHPLPTNNLHYWGYAVPIFIGFLLGPWLDLQQWQRAIQMHRERVSIAASYWVGSSFFFLLLLFHGLLTLAALNSGAATYLREGLSGYLYGHDILTRLFYNNGGTHPVTFAAYATFIIVCIITTLDSGYVALRWFLQENLRKETHALLALVPTRLLTSPIPIFVFAGLVALLASVLNLELEYFMIFYATFFVGYSGLSIIRCFMNSPANVIPQVKMFCVGSLAVVTCAYGYFLRHPIFQMLGSLLPLLYIVFLIFKPSSSEDFVSGAEELDAPANAAPLSPKNFEETQSSRDPNTELKPSFPMKHHLAGHFEGKWFVHSFVATYADTNSVGNVYFGMYAMWVGKTRELFFNRVMPRFNLKNTPFYILTRSFEHKFVRETREFETVSVRLRIARYNRKFVTLEHEIYDFSNDLLGKGQQSLLFVSSSDYKMIDIPPEVGAAFVQHT
ncbi:MAG: hypothetical protein C5B47_06500 [Verrucomicrobia bacterium]|nr:MAG: hypothetical protein C5B47_06500 [Verrucomicrobiota bacterium]